MPEENTGVDFRAVMQWVRRTRRPMTPLYVAGAVWLFGAVAFMAGWIYTLLAGVAILLVVGILTSSLRIPLLERWYALMVTIFSILWWFLASIWSPLAGWLTFVWFVASAFLAVPWWTNKRLERRIECERLIEAWPRIAAAIGEHDSVMPRGGFRITDTGWIAEVTDVNPDNLRASVRSIAQRLRLHRGRLRMEETPYEHAGRLVYEELDERGSFSEIVDPEFSSILDPLTIGVRPNGDPVQVTLYDINEDGEGHGAYHILVGGQNGSGKSGLLNAFIAHLVKAPDVLPWLVDLKGGQEFGPWSEGADWLVKDKAEAIRMINSLYHVINWRGENSLRLGLGKTWRPSPQYPVIAFIVDESAEVAGDLELSHALNKLKSVARRARSVGVLLAFATQLPTNEATGSTQIKSQLPMRFCFHMNNNAEGKHVLNNWEEARVGELPYGKGNAGWCVFELGKDSIIKLRVSMVKESTKRILSATYHRGLKAADPGTAAAAGDSYEDRDPDPLGLLALYYGDTTGNATADQGQPTPGPGAAGDGRGDTLVRTPGTAVPGTGDSPETAAEAVRGQSGDEGAYWANLVIPEQGGPSPAPGTDPAGRPARLGDDFTEDEVFSEEFPQIRNVPFSELPRTEEVPAPKLGAEAAEAALRSALRSAGEAGATPAELEKASTLSRATVYRRLEKLEQAALVEQVGYGRYAWIGREKDAQPVT